MLFPVLADEQLRGAERSGQLWVLRKRRAKVS
jgi:hypothetical protein